MMKEPIILQIRITNQAVLENLRTLNKMEMPIKIAKKKELMCKNNNKIRNKG